MSWRVPLADLHLPPAAVAAFLGALDRGELGVGPHGAEFERGLADMHGTRHAVAVSTGTAALHLVLRALGVGPGDEVMVPSLTFVATASAVRFTGARPVLCDIVAPHDPRIDPAEVSRRMTPRTRAVIAVHFGGYLADTTALINACETRGLHLIEDCAQSLGAGDIRGVAGCLSFGAKTQLPLGEGGAVVSDHAELAERVRALRSPAAGGEWNPDDPGHDYELADAHAALGKELLPGVAAEVAARGEAVRAYRRALRGVRGYRACFDDADSEVSAHFAFPVLAADVRRRTQARARLAAEGIQTTQYPALHRLTEWRSTYGVEHHPNAEEFADRHVCLPVFPGLSSNVAERVVEVLVGG